MPKITGSAIIDKYKENTTYVYGTYAFAILSICFECTNVLLLQPIISAPIPLYISRSFSVLQDIADISLPFWSIRTW